MSSTASLEDRVGYTNPPETRLNNGYGNTHLGHTAGITTMQDTGYSRPPTARRARARRMRELQLYSEGAARTVHYRNDQGNPNGTGRSPKYHFSEERAEGKPWFSYGKAA